MAAAGGGVVLLGAGDFRLSRHADEETVIIKSNVTLRGQGYATHLYLDTARGGVHLRSRAGPHRAQNRAQTLANRGALREAQSLDRQRLQAPGTNRAAIAPSTPLAADSDTVAPGGYAI